MSNFRLRDCIIKEEDLLNKAIELGHSVVAITDHETIAAAVRIEKLYNKIKEKEISLKVILGNEIYLCRDDLTGQNFISGEDKYYHFILLAKDYIGYQQICELSTRAWMRSYVSRNMRRVPTYYRDIIEVIGQNPGHVIGSSACLGGMLATQILKYKNIKDEEKEKKEELKKKIVKWCYNIEEVFGKGNFFLELQPSATIEQTYVNRALVNLSKEINIPYIITCDSHYLTLEDRPIHKAFLNAQNGDREVDAFYATTYLMSTEELEEHLDLTREELDIAYRNILSIQDKCGDYSILKPLKIPSLKWNDFKEELTNEWVQKIPMLKTFNESNFEGDRLLVKAVLNGINKHEDLQNEWSYKEINDNLEMTWISSNVNKAHWSAYYLNLQKIIDLCWEAGSIVGAGRGSGVGFILLYVLGITQINPLREETKTFSWRFLNPERVSVLDVDFDIEGSKRGAVLNKLREVYGDDRVANVTTLRTEKSRSAILTAARGLGIDVDEAQYLASLIPSDRGLTRTLKQVFYGDEENGFKPVKQFVNEVTSNYPELWNVAQKIEGLVCGTGIHAGGVIFVDEPFTNSTALMRAPDGTICTQFDLHDAEDVSLIKYDVLSVEAMDKIHVCLNLLCENNYVEKKATLRETYESVLNIYKIEREAPEMWKMIWEQKINSLFQMEKESGIRGIKALLPTSVNDLAILNSAIRLMAQEKGAETPLDKLAKFKKNPKLWNEEMDKYGLLEEEKAVLRPILSISYGLCIAQEQFMELVQLPELGGFSLTWADKLRKSIAKKNPKAYNELTQEFMKVTQEKGIRKEFTSYVWNVLIAMSRGYGFNQSHTLAYSLIGLQEMNLAYKYPIIFWNCACLIANSGSDENEEEFDEDDEGNIIKKKEKAIDYAKIAIALNNAIDRNIDISLVDINKSDFSFKPDAENNKILFGMKALSHVNTEIIEEIKKYRPYKNFKDFLNKCKLNKSAMISLIKAGAFDNLELEWANELKIEPRILIMTYYLSKASEPKTKITLQNFNGLIQRKLLPQELSFQEKVFNFNKYLKKNKYDKYYILNHELSQQFYDDNFDINELEIINGITCIEQKKWDKIYSNEMDKAREWIKDNQKEILTKLNTSLFKEIWDKYANGNISAWEMEALCFYYHEHELQNVNKAKYGLMNFNNLISNEVESYFKKNGKEIPIFKLYRIAGTVIAKNDTRASISLLTTDGVVNVKFTKEYYAMFARQISKKDENGEKHIIEKSWFTRGTKLLVTGFKREDTFVAKTYARTQTHQLYKITNVDNYGNLELTHERAQGDEEDEYI